MQDDRAVAVAFVPTLVGAVALFVGWATDLPAALSAAGFVLVLGGAVVVAASAVRVGRRDGRGTVRALLAGVRTFFGWLVAWLP